MTRLEQMLDKHKKEIMGENNNALLWEEDLNSLITEVWNEAIKECEERIQLSIGDWAWDNCNEEADVFTARPSDLLSDIEEITTRPLPRANRHYKR